MHTLHLKERTGKDGVLHINLPVGVPDADVEIVLVVQSNSAESPSNDVNLQGWPPGYFEDTFGSITDDTFVRPPQGELPTPVDFN